MISNIEVSYCYFFNCIHNEKGNCLKSPVKIGFKGVCVYKTFAKLE